MQALRNAYVEQSVVNALTAEDLTKGYETLILAEFKPQEQLHARHILVDTKEAAEKIIADLKGGASFEELAKQSKDPSGQNGGDLGFFGRGQMVPAFETAAFALQPGAVTEAPVQTEFGWHVIKLEEKRMSEPPKIEEVEGELRNYLLRQKFEGVMASLRDKYAVEIVGEPAEAAPAAGGSARRRRARRATARRDRAAAAAELTAMGGKVSPLAPASYPDVPALAGVRLATAEAGIRYSSRTDLLLIRFDPAAVVAGVFTTSRCASAPVEWDRERLAGGRARALVVNSGNANAFTGMKGRDAVRASAEAAAAAARLRRRRSVPGLDRRHRRAARPGAFRHASRPARRRGRARAAFSMRRAPS